IYVLVSSIYIPRVSTALCSLSLHDALPISWQLVVLPGGRSAAPRARRRCPPPPPRPIRRPGCERGLEGPADSPSNGSTSESQPRSEEHTSELQSRENLVCRLLLEKKKSVAN